MPLDPTVAVYVPIVEANGQQISPVYSDQYVQLKDKANSRDSQPTVDGYQFWYSHYGRNTALVGRILEEFPLDYLDHWFFYQLNQANKKIEVLPVHLKQELSVLDYRTMVSTLSLYY